MGSYLTCHIVLVVFFFFREMEEEEEEEEERILVKSRRLAVGSGDCSSLFFFCRASLFDIIGSSWLPFKGVGGGALLLLLFFEVFTTILST